MDDLAMVHMYKLKYYNFKFTSALELSSSGLCTSYNIKTLIC